jgi:hypothetical protein
MGLGAARDLVAPRPIPQPPYPAQLTFACLAIQTAGCRRSCRSPTQ